MTDLLEHLMEAHKDLFQPMKREEWIQRMMENGKWKQNPDGTWDALESVDIMHLGLTELPVQFNIVHGHFIANNNQLTSLKGSPRVVEGDFWLADNKLTSLEGGPQSVARDYVVENNLLTTLKGSPTLVGGDFYCNDNKLTTLKDGPKYVTGKVYCSGNEVSMDELFDSVNGKYSVDRV